MIGISTQVRIDSAMRTLNNVKGTRWTAAPAREAGRMLKEQLAKYPVQASPKRGQKVYRRKGNLGRGWSVSVKVLSGSVQVSVSNPVRYSPFVQSERLQASWHRGRWTTEEKVLRENTGKIEALFKAALNREADKT